MTTMRLRAIAATGVTLVTLGCGDVPFLPQWDADLYATIGAANLTGVTPGLVVPGGTSVNVSGPLRSVPMDGTTGAALGEALDAAAQVIRLEIRVTKTPNLALALADTIVFAADSTLLATSPVLGGITMAPGETFRVDTLSNIPGLVPLLQQLVDNDGTLYTRTRGRVSNAGGPLTVQPTDSIHVRLGLLIRVPVTGGGN
jgi:hypothetical protein